MQQYLRTSCYVDVGSTPHDAWENPCPNYFHFNKYVHPLMTKATNSTLCDRWLHETVVIWKFHWCLLTRFDVDGRLCRWEDHEIVLSVQQYLQASMLSQVTSIISVDKRTMPHLKLFQIILPLTFYDVYRSQRPYVKRPLLLMYFKPSCQQYLHTTTFRGVSRTLGDRWREKTKQRQFQIGTIPSNNAYSLSCWKGGNGRWCDSRRLCTWEGHITQQFLFWIIRATQQYLLSIMLSGVCQAVDRFLHMTFAMTGTSCFKSPCRCNSTYLLWYCEEAMDVAGFVHETVMPRHLPFWTIL
jgi:hypothetical protein